MISTHILDTGLGKPASNVLAHLFNEQGLLIGKATTNQDGRIANFGETTFAEGHYSLEFFTAEYFENLNIETFFPKAVIENINIVIIKNNLNNFFLIFVFLFI